MDQAEHQKKKWQNLVKKKCIKCEGKLQREESNAVVYRCENNDFLITERKFFEILMDESHILRRYLTSQERKELNSVIDNLIQ